MGIEPTRPKAHEFESCASTSSATSAAVCEFKGYFLSTKIIFYYPKNYLIKDLFITFNTILNYLMLKINIIISLFFIPLLFGISQNRVALIKELTEQDGVYYLKGEKFTGSAFRKNNKGKFITDEPFKNGLLHGKRMNYNSKGVTILAKEKFKKGKGVFRTYHSNNKLKSLGLIDKSIKYGIWVYYDRKGIVKAKEKWSEEIPNQLEWEKFYNDRGLIESELYYKMGILNREVYYDENGKVFKTNKN